MKHLFNIFVLMFLLGCATSNVEAQSGKTKVQSKIASYEAEKTLR
jgi:outer membrane lipoprotein-sorting protein